MIKKTFSENFELLADAPDSVQKLREMILLLAVQGKLMPQGREDEPAGVLLEKIKVIKERLAKEGKFRKSKFLPPIREDEKYFKLPTGWQWVRFDDICSYIQRGKGPKYIEKSDIPVVSQKCIQWDGFKLDRAKFISPSTLEKYNEERFLITGDLLWNSTGTGTIGRVNVYVHEDNSYDKIVADSHVTVIRPILMNSCFFYCWVASPIIQNEIEKMASGTTNQIELNLSTIKNYLVPLPPFEEQKRIVAKVDQLTALCDELEARQQNKDEQRTRLNNAAIDKLLTASTPEEFAQHWQRICDNFNLLYDVPETVGLLRQAILQMAVQGKLVAQDEGDEPAVVLLDRIMAEKRRLVNEKKIKKDIAFEPISEEEIDFKLPIGWVLCRVGEFTTIKGGKRLPNGAALTKVPTDHIYIRVSDMKNGAIDDNDLHYITDEVHEKIKNYIIEKDDLYLTIVGSTIGKLGIVPDKFHKMNLTENAARIIIYEIDKYFLNYSLNSHFIQNQFFNKTKQLGQPKLALNRIASTLFPLAPFEEQKRIVAKVEQLMALCDELEAGLVQAQTEGGELMEAVVHQLCRNSQS
jgi:type I restriction enzyme S subunit